VFFSSRFAAAVQPMPWRSSTGARQSRLDAQKIPGWIGAAITGGIFIGLVLLELRRPLREAKSEPKLRRNVRNIAVAGTSAMAIMVTAAPVTTDGKMAVGTTRARGGKTSASGRISNSPSLKRSRAGADAVLKFVQPAASTTSEITQRLIKMHEFVALRVVNARQFIARAVACQSGGDVRQAPGPQQPAPTAQVRQQRSGNHRSRADANPEHLLTWTYILFHAIPPLNRFENRSASGFRLFRNFFEQKPIAADQQ